MGDIMANVFFLKCFSAVVYKAILLVYCSLLCECTFVSVSSLSDKIHMNSHSQSIEMNYRHTYCISDYRLRIIGHMWATECGSQCPCKSNGCTDAVATLPLEQRHEIHPASKIEICTATVLLS